MGCERHTDCSRAQAARAQGIAVHLEQELAETRRHLEATVAQLGDLDAWTSSERDRVLAAAREHLARTGVTA